MDAVRVQAVIEPRETVVTLRELANRAFNTYDEESQSRAMVALQILQSHGRIMLNIGSHGFLAATSLDSKATQWQAQAIMRLMMEQTPAVPA